ncbi:metal-dependent hydrolase [Penicillium pulvis]|uniref:metal-dependent hydrolase n=1 Tax=Penicillium pulvis TaxID=1562058 RepID=UPI0025495053|nr:metal-dependent hydrolase [Penicillium pulvis]KAJ5798927.1 metal-dependent hydrolase [Penicillium pulvis]
MIPLIALEEHYLSSAVLQSQKVDRYANFPPHMQTKLKTLGDGRVQDLDNGKISLHIISHCPGIRDPAVCCAANDELAAAISSEKPARMMGFAMLPMDNPTAAVKELERCVKDLRFVDLSKHYKGNYDDRIGFVLGGGGWGWHSETALSLLKLFASGFFDHFPKSKIVVGHMGEMIPFQLERVITISETWGLKGGFREVWTQNIWVSTSGMFAIAPLACLLQTTDISHVLYSVDYPFSSNEKGLEFFEKVRSSGLLSDDDLEKFAYRNAEGLLGVKADKVL